MRPAYEQPFWTKSGWDPQIWSISAAGRTPGAKCEQPARIWNTLVVEERGDRGVEALAAAQNDVVHSLQLAAIGMSRSAIRHRVDRGSLRPLLPGVFLVGHPRPKGRAAETAALLYVGEDAALSHASAAILWGIRPAAPGDVIMTVVGRKVRLRKGVHIHRVAALDLRHVRLRHGLPLTAPARTLIDLAAGGDDLDAALNEARVQGLVDDAALDAALQRAPGRTGTARLRALLNAETGPALTRSELERRLRDLIRAGGLPWPQFNVMVRGYLVDAIWPEARVIVETDGYAVHGHRSAFERDRRRDLTLAAAGYLVIRVSWRQLLREPMAVLARLAESLALAHERAHAG